MNQPPKWEPALIEQKEKINKKQTPKWGQCLSSKIKRKKKRNPQIGAVLIEQKKEKRKTNDWPPQSNMEEGITLCYRVIWAEIVWEILYKLRKRCMQTSIVKF